MARIIYLAPTGGAIQGGIKMIIRQVEALRALGFDAYCMQGVAHKRPTWFDYDVPIIGPTTVSPDDTVVSPDDAGVALKALASQSCRVVVLSQNPYYFALLGFQSIDAFPVDKLPRFLAVSRGLKRVIQRAYPAAQVDIVPCFADERVFQPATEKGFRIAYAPKKRDLEARMIREFVRKFHPRHDNLEWVTLERMRETHVARLLAGSSLFLSLNRLESVGMTTLEAMASGCLCAGFTGIGGEEYATERNGLWVREDDCEAAADAVAQAADLVRAKSPEVEDYLAAGAAAAAEWSYRRFLERLEAVWMRLAPEARTL